MDYVKNTSSDWKYDMPYVDKGDVLFKFDETGWYVLDVIGNTNPEFFGGYTNTFNWRNWSLNALFTFSYGNEQSPKPGYTRIGTLQRREYG